jgi:hypothetical protein
VETTSKPEDSHRAATLAGFQQLLVIVVKSCAAIDIRSYELAGVARLLAELRPATLKLLGEGRSLIGSLLDTCEILRRPYPGVRSIPPFALSSSSGSGERRFERALDAALASNRVSLEAVEEMAFMAQIELGQRADRLERSGLGWEAAALLGECDSSLRRLRKSLNAVGLTLARLLGVPALAEYRSELESSLAIRRGLKSFRVRVNKGGEPAPHQLKERFRYIANQIEILVSWDIYSGMRVRDRLLLRSLQQRLLAWLQMTNASPEAGMRLWQDIAACVEMFALVNRRQELVEHDTLLLTQCVDTLKALQPQDAVDPALVRQLRAAEGLDMALDGVMDQRDLKVEALLNVLTRLVSQPAPQEETPAASGDELW